MSRDPEAEQEIDFSRYWRLLAARWWVPIGGLVLGAIVGYALALGGSQRDSASATPYLGQPHTASRNVSLQGLPTNPNTRRSVADPPPLDPPGRARWPG